MIDDTWSAGGAGLYAAADATSSLTFDNFKVGLDNNANDDIADAGDDQLLSDDFGANVISLSYDDNGNLTLDTLRPAARGCSRGERRALPEATSQGLTDDGVYNFVYDAWNRLRKAQLVESSDTTTIAEYEYYGDTRRARAPHISA